MKPSKKSLINKNDALARQINILLHGNKCCRCGRDGDSYKLDWSHVFGRGAKIIRWCEDNALLMCFVCHKWWHENPLASAEWFESKYPGVKAYLQANLNDAHPMHLRDYMEINRQLKERLCQLQQSL